MRCVGLVSALCAPTARRHHLLQSVAQCAATEIETPEAATRCLLAELPPISPPPQPLYEEVMAKRTASNVRKSTPESRALATILRAASPSASRASSSDSGPGGAPGGADTACAASPLVTNPGRDGRDEDERAGPSAAAATGVAARPEPERPGRGRRSARVATHTVPASGASNLLAASGVRRSFLWGACGRPSELEERRRRDCRPKAANSSTASKRALRSML